MKPSLIPACALLTLPLAASAQSTNAVTNPATSIEQMNPIIVTGSLDTARDEITPDLGASVYTISSGQIATQSQGDNAPFNQTLLRAPGVAEDSFGQLHVRGEHANLQYRINDVLIPEGITGFGQELDTRFLSLGEGAILGVNVDDAGGWKPYCAGRAPVMRETLPTRQRPPSFSSASDDIPSGFASAEAGE